MARLNTTAFPKLTENIIKNLEFKKIITVFDFVHEETEKLTKITQLSYKEITETKEFIVKKFGGKQKNPNELFDNQKQFLSTGIISLDELLKNGLRPGEILELCGVSSSGKSQLCLSLATNVALNCVGRINYIFSHDNFSAMRIQMILEENKINDEVTARVMHQIHVTHVETICDLLNTLYYLAKSFKEPSSDESTKLLIIDSLPGVFFTSDNQDNFIALNQLANICRYLANEFCLPIITTNLTQHWNNSDDITQSGNSSKPALGKYWSSIPNTRLFIESLEDENRKITVWKSGSIKIGSNINININNRGIM